MIIKIKIVYFIENGPFSLHAPTTDISYSSLTKEDIDMLLLTYGGDETSYQYSLSLMEFGKDNSQTLKKLAINDEDKTNSIKNETNDTNTTDNNSDNTNINNN